MATPLNGDTIITESIGTSLARRFWPENSAKWAEAAEARRMLDYRKTRAPSDEWLRAHASEILDFFEQHRREQDVFKAVFIAAGKNPNPAPAE
jgi:hypothetical protein